MSVDNKDVSHIDETEETPPSLVDFPQEDDAEEEEEIIVEILSNDHESSLINRIFKVSAISTLIHYCKLPFETAFDWLDGNPRKLEVFCRDDIHTLIYHDKIPIARLEAVYDSNPDALLQILNILDSNYEGKKDSFSKEDALYTVKDIPYEKLPALLNPEALRCLQSYPYISIKQLEILHDTNPEALSEMLYALDGNPKETEGSLSEDDAHYIARNITHLTCNTAKLSALFNPDTLAPFISIYGTTIAQLETVYDNYPEDFAQLSAAVTGSPQTKQGKRFVQHVSILAEEEGLPLDEIIRTYHLENDRFNPTSLVTKVSIKNPEKKQKTLH